MVFLNRESNETKISLIKVKRVEPKYHNEYFPSRLRKRLSRANSNREGSLSEYLQKPKYGTVSKDSRAAKFTRSMFEIQKYRAGKSQSPSYGAYGECSFLFRSILIRYSKREQNISTFIKQLHRVCVQMFKTFKLLLLKLCHATVEKCLNPEGNQQIKQINIHTTQLSNPHCEFITFLCTPWGFVLIILTAK